MFAVVKGEGVDMAKSQAMIKNYRRAIGECHYEWDEWRKALCYRQFILRDQEQSGRALGAFLAGNDDGLDEEHSECYGESHRSWNVSFHSCVLP